MIPSKVPKNKRKRERTAFPITLIWGLFIAPYYGNIPSAQQARYTTNSNTPKWEDHIKMKRIS